MRMPTVLRLLLCAMLPVAGLTMAVPAAAAAACPTVAASSAGNILGGNTTFSNSGSTAGALIEAFLGAVLVGCSTVNADGTYRLLVDMNDGTSATSTFPGPGQNVTLVLAGAPVSTPWTMQPGSPPSGHVGVNLTVPAVLPTTRADIYGGPATLDGNSAAPGAYVDAFCRNGTLCGATTVDSSGNYRMDVYGNDGSLTAVANYAQAGDTIILTIDGFPATLTNITSPPSGSAAWQSGVGVVGTLAGSTVLTQTESLTLAAGWHLLTLSVHPPSTRLAAVLSSLGANYDVVFGFDQTLGGITSFFTDPSKSVLNNLTDLLPLHGYWVHVTQAATLTITGNPLTTSDAVQLQSGWNLVGYASTTAAPIATVLSELNNRLDVLFGFDLTLGGITSYFSDPGKSVLNDITQLVDNQGYWIHLTGSGSQGWTGS